MVDSICLEIQTRKNYLEETVETIYFGGGTPSLLAPNQVEEILKQITTQFEIARNPEITLEANPEDLTNKKCSDLKSIGINRLSIGIQTFDKGKLIWMNRIHNTDQSYAAYENARSANFNNISLDLMYALPDMSSQFFENDLKKIVNLDPEHISLYGLTIEDKTVFGRWKNEGSLIEVPEENAAQQYLEAISYLKENGFKQYEVSNFGKEGFHSKHNNAYWEHKSYLGVGPGSSFLQPRVKKV